MVLETGDTEVEPLNSVNIPTPWSMVTVLAFVTSQLNIELSPSMIDEGTAVKEIMVGLSVVTPLQPNRNDKNVRSIIIK